MLTRSDVRPHQPLSNFVVHDYLNAPKCPSKKSPGRHSVGVGTGRPDPPATCSPLRFPTSAIGDGPAIGTTLPSSDFIVWRGPNRRSTTLHLHRPRLPPAPAEPGREAVHHPPDVEPVVHRLQPAPKPPTARHSFRSTGRRLSPPPPWLAPRRLGCLSLGGPSARPAASPPACLEPE